MNELWIDVETTGLDPQNCAILEIALIPVIDAEEKPPICKRIKAFAGAKIEESALKVNGLNPDEGEGYSEAIKDIIKQLSEYNCKFKLCGHNVMFDKQFFYYAFCRNGSYGQFDTMFYNETKCTLALSKKVKQLKRNNLKSCCEFFGIEIGKHHSALDDIKATIKLSKHLPSETTEEDNLSHMDKVNKYMSSKYVMINADGSCYIHSSTMKDRKALTFILSELYNRFVN